ncbi:autotransporter domain-containing protein [Sphingomonas qomolangmaensis]|uniref:Autotransporter domain-containing protein n=1 Tax=Sphingomonas qomolangmaensis TaxID=2918765 RepID=A0ABY5LDP6_9SPHN|nr:autotransporter domain-containing protein [Sphingomonas qomolangmaensis]UUL83808.1 autotransporter domain-containing protein [Sphingomonas qomolangmaensis]
MAGKFLAWSVRPRLVSFALGTSVLAITAGASPASAQCAPDPTSVNGTTTCSGVDTDGLNVPTSGTRVVVQPGATVLAGSNAAGIATSGATSTLVVDGAVLGGVRPGISVTNANAYFGYLGPCDPYAGATFTPCGSPFGTVSPPNATSISIGAAGTVSGTSAVRLQANPNNTAGTLTATIVNAGTLTGTSGPALVADSGAYFTGITNQVGGRIEGIAGVTRSIDNFGTINRGIVVGAPANFTFATLVTNAGTINGGVAGAIQSVRNTGTIDGGTGSAIAGIPASAFNNVQLNNDGRITSNGNAATVTSTGGALVQNTGSIINAGTGAAIEASGILNVTNAAGATIGSNGSVAVRTSGVLNLTNAGTIDGSVVSAGVANQNATLDIAAGTINGDLLLGASNDSVTARFDVAAGRIGSVTGVIDAGSGADTLNLGIDGDATLNAAAVPASFERLGLAIADATVTLADGIRLPNGLTATGSGNLVNAATLVTAGQAIAISASYPGTLSLVNNGAITANVTNSFGAAVSVNVGELTNNGTITAIGGGGISVTSYTQNALTNTGTITASGFGALVYSGALVNSGTIRSTGNVGSVLNGSQSNSAPSSNSGLIAGATSGLSMSFGRFVNTGIVTGGATGSGVGIDITYYGIVDNQAGGTISGATGISARTGYNGTVLNAGTINGGVDFESRSSYDQSPDIFVDNGGVVNGAIRFGGGNDLLVTDLVQPTARVLGGATGGVDAGDGLDRILYRVGADAAVQIAPPAGFETIGYELTNDAALTLTATGLLDTNLTLSGSGKADVTADIAAANRTLIDMSALTIDRLLGDSDAAPNTLDVISRGTLTASATDSFAYLPTHAVIAGPGRFENAGTINVTGTPSEYFYFTPFAIVGSGTVINSGTINLAGGAYGIDAPTVINSGSILSSAGSGSSGVLGVETLQNSGSIVTDGPAVAGTYFYSVPSQITNTGRIESRRDTALSVYGGSNILNDIGGLIQGPTQAIVAYGSTLINRGTIVGDVDLASDLGYTSSSYGADGGTLAGALTFGGGNDVFVQTGAATGITDVIDGGEGSDAVILARNGAGSFTGAINFETLAVNAGIWTLTGAQRYSGGTTIAAGAIAIGTGSVLNGAIANAGALVFDQSTNTGFTGAITGTGSVTKAGTGVLTLGTQGYSGATNVTGGTLALTGALASSDYMVGAGAALTSANAATIATTGQTLSVLNAGTIANTNASGRAINVAGVNGPRTIAIVNAAGGVITSADDAIRINTNPTAGSIRIDNSGTIRTTGGGQALDFDAAASGAASIIINNHVTGVIRSFGQDAIRPGQGAIVTNAGLIRSDGAPNNSYDGIDWQARSGVVTNLATGIVSGLRHGITSDTAVDVANAGVIEGRNGSGVGSDGTGMVVNYGTITGAWAGVATNGDGDGVDIDLIGTVRNFGTIRGLSANGVDSGGQPNGAEGIAMGGGTIENAAGATISGATRGILIDNGSASSAYGATTIVNAGTIQGGTGAAATLVGAFDDVIINSGNIVGGSNGLASDFGAGNDTLALLPGSAIIGRVDGGAGTDQIVLGGTGTGSFAGAVNFERLDIVSGDWSLTTASSFANGAGIAAGATLAGTTATLRGAIANAGTLRIDQAGDGVFDATLLGTGELVKAGAGNVTIGNQLGFTGRTSIEAGRLTLAGTLPSKVTVQAGATLGGNGTVASAVVASGGTIAPGNSIGTITIAGNLVQQAGSVYAAEIGAAGLSNRIVVGGTATLQSGARLAITGTAGAIGTRYTLLTATGGVAGTYAVTQPTTTDTELRLGYTGNAVVADVARTGTGLTRVARTTNQRAVAPAFAALGIGNAAYAALTLVPDNDAVARAFDALGGEVHASLRNAMVRDAQIVQGAVLSRTLAGDPSSGLWGTVLANSGQDDGSIEAAAVDRETLGGVGGVDIMAGTGRIGIAGGYTRTQLAVDARTSDAEAKTIHVLGYAGGAYGAIRVRAGIGYAWADNRTDRSVAFPGFADRLRGDYDGDTFHSFAEAGYAIPLGGGTVQPFAGFQAFRVHTDGVAEAGGVTALTIAERTESFAFASAGLRFDTPIVDGLSARGVTAWQRRIDGDAPSGAARFTAGTSTFDIAGVPLSRDAVNAGIDIVWAPTPNIRVTSGYAGLIGTRGTDSTFKLTASIGF